MKVRRILVAAMITLAGISTAHAYERCQTESNGYRFHGGGRDLTTALNMAINECTTSSYTKNGECRGNVKCEDYNGNLVLAQVKCETKSNGYSFTGGGANLNIARADAIGACTESSYTSNGDCRANVKCESAVSRPHAVNASCKTNSNGYSFNGGGLTILEAKRDAISACHDSSYTSNGECNAEVECRSAGEHRYQSVNWSCESKSNGYKFKGGADNRDQAIEDAISACTSSSYTQNGECYATVQCKRPELGGVQRPRPVDRIPTPVRTINFKAQSLELAERVISLVEAFEPYVNAEDYTEIMLPLKKQASRLSARVEGRAQYERVKNTLVYFGTLLDSSESFIEENMERSALFDAAKELLTVKERVRSLLELMDRVDGTNHQLY